MGKRGDMEGRRPILVVSWRQMGFLADEVYRGQKGYLRGRTDSFIKMMI
jgi:hypothetical protein